MKSTATTVSKIIEIEVAETPTPTRGKIGINVEVGLVPLMTEEKGVDLQIPGEEDQEIVRQKKNTRKKNGGVGVERRRKNVVGVEAGRIRKDTVDIVIKINTVKIIVKRKIGEGIIDDKQK